MPGSTVIDVARSVTAAGTVQSNRRGEGGRRTVAM
jgi:hypothetical protein